MSAPTPATLPVKTKSKAYSSTVAIQGDAAKYRLKYKELKKKVREIEVENDKLHLKTLRIKRNIQRMRLERAILYERLEAETQANDRDDPYRRPDPVDVREPRDYPPYHPTDRAPRGASPPVSANYRELERDVAPPSRSSVSRRAYGYADDYPPHPPPAGVDRAERLRQYTPSASPEPSHADPDTSARSSMKVTLRRGG
ncbi:hypothetical protein BCV70DRAFT_213397 [Testicularia cyperi]|uniref:INO80 complex subunit F domain-containing protein n=1 Tax=Testicularia cyperi TaxID=1882483 RepID=A0A317XJ02_9BASI|nr:hypothetical protein BCV70DRAFT_213397 [Testicularia cyperi]